MNDSEENRGSAQEKDFLYSVLNLHNAASQAEINERHRSLSLIFHPDKHHGEKSLDIATKRFLEIQKAYQVLSDPFLREVYDELGENGLLMNWPEEIRSKPREEIRDILKGTFREVKQRELENLILPRGRVDCSIDASPLFGPYLGSPEDRWGTQILHRLDDVRLLGCNLRHRTQKKIDDKTQVSFTARIHRQGNSSGCNFLGTLRHQFSPRLAFEATSMLLSPHVLNMNATYRDDDSSISVRTSCAPLSFYRLPPVLTVSLNRKLFPRRFEQGSLTFHISRQPNIALNFVSPTPFDLRPIKPSLDGETTPQSLPPSVSGLGVGVTHKSFGFVLNPVDPRLTGECGVAFTELALQLKVGLDCGLAGLVWIFSGSWSNETSQVSATTIVNAGGVVLNIDLTHMEQRITLPIVLSQERNPMLAFWTVLAPSTAMVLGYHFILKPRRRAQRLAHIRAARRALDENSGVGREREATASLLRDTARKHMQAETSKGGLVVLEATYGSIEQDDGAKDLTADVTVPIQALVRKSQLYVPGHQTKSGIQGFIDPAPFVSKSLRVRYLFRGRMHYAEIPDSTPVVLPLADHLVE